MTSSNGKLFRATGSLCGESTGPRWIPLTTASDAELWCFLGSAPRINGWVDNREAGDLRRHRAHYGVIVRVVQRLYRSYWLCITSIYINMTLMVWFFAMPLSILTLQHCLLRKKDEAMSLLLSVTLVIVRPLGDIHSYIFVANDVSFICTVVFIVSLSGKKRHFLYFVEIQLQIPYCTHSVHTYNLRHILCSRFLPLAQ